MIPINFRVYSLIKPDWALRVPEPVLNKKQKAQRFLCDPADRFHGYSVQYHPQPYSPHQNEAQTSFGHLLSLAWSLFGDGECLAGGSTGPCDAGFRSTKYIPSVLASWARCRTRGLRRGQDMQFWEPSYCAQHKSYVSLYTKTLRNPSKVMQDRYHQQ